MIRHHTVSGRRWRVFAIGACAIAGSLLIGAVAEVVDAPTARADEFSQVIDNIQAAQTLGQSHLDDAVTAFTAGDNLQGLYDTFIGLDDKTLAPGFWLLQGGLDYFTGADLPAPTAFDFDDLGAPPATWADALSEVSVFSGYGEELLNGATVAFSSGDLSLGLYDTIGVISIFDVINPELLVLGLASGA